MTEQERLRALEKQLQEIMRINNQLIDKVTKLEKKITESKTTKEDIPEWVEKVFLYHKS